MTEPTLTFDLERAVALYWKIKDKVAAIEAEHAEKLKAALKNKEGVPYPDILRKMEGRFTEALVTLKQDSAVTLAGTIHWEVKYTAPLQEKDVFMKFVIDNKQFDLLERRASSVAVREYAIKNGTFPPGCKLDASRKVVVNRPSTEKKLKATANAIIDKLISDQAGATNERTDVPAAGATVVSAAAEPTTAGDAVPATAA